MKKFLLKLLLMTIIVYSVVISVNYFVDPASLYHSNVVKAIKDELLAGNIIESPGDVDEGRLQETIISSLEKLPDTVIIGSSHVMYQPWEFEDYYIAGVSGAYLGDYYALIGIMEYYHDSLPSKIIIGIDPWAFMTGIDKGRHTSIEPYAEYEQLMINGSASTDGIIGNTKNNIEKVKEIVSFPYFQTSLRAIISGGIEHYMNRDEIVICEDDSMGDKAKILPTGRRILSLNGINTKEENDASAQNAMNQNTIYQLGSDFTELPMNHLNDFELLIQHLLETNVEVEFYFHPWYPSVYLYFETTKQYSGVIELEKYIRENTKKYNITVHGSYNPYELHMTEEDFADWLHLKADKMLESYKIVR